MKNIVKLLSVFVFLSSAANAEVIGSIADKSGGVGFEREGKKYRAVIGQPVHEGDIVFTSGSGKVRIYLKDNSVISLAPKSKLKLENLRIDESRTFSVFAMLGQFKMDVAKFFLGKTEGTIRTQSITAGVRGTVVWGDVGLDAFCVLEGAVELGSTNEKANGQTVDLKGGDCRTGMAQGEFNTLQPTPEELAGFLKAFDTE